MSPLISISWIERDNFIPDQSCSFTWGSPSIASYSMHGMWNCSYFMSINCITYHCFFWFPANFNCSGNLSMIPIFIFLVLRNIFWIPAHSSLKYNFYQCSHWFPVESKEIVSFQVNNVLPIEEVHKLHPIPCMECGIVPRRSQANTLHINFSFKYQAI